MDSSFRFRRCATLVVAAAFASGLLSLAAAPGAAAVAAQAPPAPAILWPTSGWTTATPESQGLPAGRFAALDREIRDGVLRRRAPVPPARHPRLPLEEDADRTSRHRGRPPSRRHDLAKIGHLYLHDGMWDGRRVLPAGWVKDATTRHARAVGPNWDYGFQWWLTTRGGVDVWAGRGFGGQFLIVIPSRDVVGVIYSWNVFGGRARNLFEPLVDALIR